MEAALSRARVTAWDSLPAAAHVPRVRPARGDELHPSRVPGRRRLRDGPGEPGSRRGRGQPDPAPRQRPLEVLSPSTEAYDRGEKWQAYQRLGSLRDYLLVSQREARVEHYQRTEGGWRYAALGEGERIELAGGASFAVDDLYRGAFDYPGDAAPDPVDASSGD